MKSQKKAFTLGWQVFAGLMVLTVVEFWVASMAEGPIPYPPIIPPLAPVTWLALWISANPLPFLAVLAIPKALLILHYFMHVSQAWREGDHS